MFNNIYKPFDHEKHDSYSAFHAFNLKTYNELFTELEMRIKDYMSSSHKHEINNEINSNNRYISAFLSRTKERTTMIPPLYLKHSRLSINDKTDYSEVKLVNEDTLFGQNILIYPENSSLKEYIKNLSEKDYFSDAEDKKTIWNDEIVKKIVSKMDIDVVINLDSFVNLLIFSLNELKEDGFLPWLKIETADKQSIIFDKVLRRNMKIEHEHKKYLNNCIKRHCGSVNKDDFDNYGSYDYNKDSILAYATEINKNNINYKQCGFTNKYLSRSEGKYRNYSYGLWKLMDLTVLFRFKSYFWQKDNKISRLYSRIQLKKEDENENIEELLKFFIGSNLNLKSDIMKMIIDPESGIINDIHIENYKELTKKMKLFKNYESALKKIRNIFAEIKCPTKFGPDYYILHLKQEEINVFKSTNDINGSHLDLRDLNCF